VSPHVPYRMIQMSRVSTAHRRSIHGEECLAHHKPELSRLDYELTLHGEGRPVPPRKTESALGVC